MRVILYVAYATTQIYGENHVAYIYAVVSIILHIENTCNGVDNKTMLYHRANVSSRLLMMQSLLVPIYGKFNFIFNLLGTM